MRQVLLAILAAGCVAYGGMVAYLRHFDHATAPVLPAASPTRHDPVALAAFSAIRESRCDFCHARNAELPFYFAVPGAKQVMAHDVEQGLRHFRIESVIADFKLGKPASEEQLSRIEEVVRQDRMPPRLYLLMHWHARLSPTETDALLTWIAQTRRIYYATPGVAAQFAAEPIQPIPETLVVDQNKALLGKRLFFDKRLSGDNTLNCASCHALQHGGVDGLVTATGIHGQKGPINVPTVFNAVFNIRQFWNGRASSLADQAAGPVMNPLEMGSHDWAQVAGKLGQDPSYPPQFRASFGSGTIGRSSITEAIAAYEATLITPDSRFDRYLKGDTAILTAQERHGYELFKSVGCSGCHSGKAAGGDGFEIMGLEGDYFTARGGGMTPADQGEFAVTHAPADRSRFKIPNLRNVALTAPYFHDGSASTLDQAVRAMVRYQTPAGSLADPDIAALVAFLRTLTGTYLGRMLTSDGSR